MVVPTIARLAVVVLEPAGHFYVLGNGTAMERLNRISEQEESHELYARYISIPVQVLHLLESKEVSPREALLLGLIDGFCNHSRGRLCVASNRYIAKRLGCSYQQVQTMLTKLRKQGLIQSKNEHGGDLKRELLVCWPT